MNSTKRKGVLLVLPGEDRPVVGLLRAAMLARLHGGALHVVRVFPGRSSAAGDSALALREMVENLGLLTATRRWIHDVTAVFPAPGRVRVETGDLTEVAANRAQELGVGLVVVPPGGLRLGARVASLARQTRLPVLVARDAGGEAGILAATDLRDARYPVLEQAAVLSRQLGVSLVAVHNSNPLLGLGLVTTPEGAVAVQPGTRRALREHLQHAVQQLAVKAEVVVADELNPATAILREARARDADVIVVGTRPRSWFGRLTCSNTAAEVVNSASRSVLVTPLDPLRP